MAGKAGRSGRKAQPTRLKLLNGTRADRIPKREPEAPGGSPERPAWLNDPVEVEGWDIFTEDVGRLGLLSPVDRHNASMFAMLYAAARVNRGDIQNRGRTIDGPHGPVLNPSIRDLKDNLKGMRDIMAGYGLSPADRSRLGASDAGTTDELEQFKRERGIS